MREMSRAIRWLMLAVLVAPLAACGAKVECGYGAGSAEESLRGLFSAVAADDPESACVYLDPRKSESSGFDWAQDLLARPELEGKLASDIEFVEDVGAQMASQHRYSIRVDSLEIAQTSVMEEPQGRFLVLPD